jgi:hypothetical protein
MEPPGMEGKAVHPVTTPPAASIIFAARVDHVFHRRFLVIAELEVNPRRRNAPRIFDVVIDIDEVPRVLQPFAGGADTDVRSISSVRLVFEFAAENRRTAGAAARQSKRPFQAHHVTAYELFTAGLFIDVEKRRDEHPGSPAILIGHRPVLEIRKVSYGGGGLVVVGAAIEQRNALTVPLSNRVYGGGKTDGVLLVVLIRMPTP